MAAPEVRGAQATDQWRQLCQQFNAADQRLCFGTCVPGLWEICHGSFQLEPPAGTWRHKLRVGRAPPPDAPERTLSISVCCCRSLLWSRVAHGGLQECAADCEVPSLQRAFEIVWCFHVFAAWVKCSDPDAPSNVGAHFNCFLKGLNIFACNCDHAPALTQPAEFSV